MKRTSRRNAWLLAGALLAALAAGLGLIAPFLAGGAKTQPAVEEVAAAWVNERPISQETFMALARTLRETQNLKMAEAYQAAFTLMVQDMLLHDAAVQQGFSATRAEVNERVRAQLETAHENEALGALYQSQAAELGTDWESSQFRAYLFQQWSLALPVEKLNQRLAERAGGDLKKIRAFKLELLAPVLDAAEIRLNEAGLPEGAEEIHAPGIAEMPVFQQ